ncbi:MAG: UxaA family hydrolase [Candidatus Heimdallarchaeota archaeon]
MQNKFIVMHPNDNCATALTEILEDTKIIVKDRIIIMNQKIPNAHKFALVDIKTGEFVLKYGEVIGVAIKDIKSGDWVHTHNLKSHYLNEVIK